MAGKKTKYASIERSSSSQINKTRHNVVNNELFVEALNSFPDIVLILNKNRQVVFCNELLLKTLGFTEQDVLGKRPGEIFGCIHAADEQAGYRTSEFCAECGAVKSILLAQKGEQNYKECRMVIRKGKKEDSLDLRVWSVPVVFPDEVLVIFTIKDIADEKRCKILERPFFHDVLNEATVLMFKLYQMQKRSDSTNGEAISALNAAAKMMVNTIKEQRDLLKAEHGELAMHPAVFSVRELLDDLVNLYRDSEIAYEKTLLCNLEETETVLRSDRAILARVLGNLIKNALESAACGSTVTVKFSAKSNKYIFSVHNPEVMPVSVKYQIFQRSFTTKGEGRGIGTYSVKLLTEIYLKGTVSFTSEEEKGTTFVVQINDLE